LEIVYSGEPEQFTEVVFSAQSRFPEHERCVRPARRCRGNESTPPRPDEGNPVASLCVHQPVSGEERVVGHGGEGQVIQIGSVTCSAVVEPLHRDATRTEGLTERRLTRLIPHELAV
jgi:hypothetical protein